jgi:hypothetical protein
MKLHLADLLDKMEVPEERKNLNLKSNIRWLKLNLANSNLNHHYLEDALELIRNLAKRLRC